MRRLAIPLSAAALSVGIAACGSSGGSTSTVRATTPSSHVAPAAGTTTTPTTANRQTQNGQTQRYAAAAQRTITRIASASGQLASGHSTSEQQARAALARLQRQARQLSASAQSTLAPSNPARPLIAQVMSQAASAAGRLRGERVTPSSRSTLLAAQRNLDSLARSIGRARTQLAQANLTTITGDLQSLARQLNLTASSGSSAG